MSIMSGLTKYSSKAIEKVAMVKSQAKEMTKKLIPTTAVDRANVMSAVMVWYDTSPVNSFNGGARAEMLPLPLKSALCSYTFTWSGKENSRI